MFDRGRGLLFVLSAPSGCGKGTLRKALLERDKGLKFCPSVTTRAPRPGEIDGVDYKFVTKEEFLALERQGTFIEWAEVYGNLYGTPGEDLERARKSGWDVIIEKDVQGAKTLKKRCPDAIFIFVLAPSFEELQRRMKARGTETQAEMERRFRMAQEEVRELGIFDYVIINDDLKRAQDRLYAIVLGERLLLQGSRTPRARRRSCHAQSAYREPGEKGELQVCPGDRDREESQADSGDQKAESSRYQESCDRCFDGDLGG